MRTWIDVAVLAKSKHKDGRFAVRSTAGLPFLLEEGDEVAFVPPQTDLPRLAIVEDIKLVDDHRADVAFRGIDSLSAQGLVGCHCLIRRSEIDDALLEEPSQLWDGWTVVDEKLGEIGAVKSVVDNPAQSLLEVDRLDRDGLLLVPAVDEIIIGVDVDAREIRTQLPEGLLDL